MKNPKNAVQNIPPDTLLDRKKGGSRNAGSLIYMVKPLRNMDLIPGPFARFTGFPDSEFCDGKDFTGHKQTISDIFSITPFKYFLFLIKRNSNTIVFE